MRGSPWENQWRAWTRGSPWENPWCRRPTSVNLDAKSLIWCSSHMIHKYVDQWVGWLVGRWVGCREKVFGPLASNKESVL